jgi:hypothetical protein
MSHDPTELRHQIEQLKAENERLRKTNDYLLAQRKKYMDAVYADLDVNAPTEEEVKAGMVDPARMPLSKFLADLGLSRKDEPNPK